MTIVFSRVYLICLIGLAIRNIVSLCLETLFIVNDNDLHGAVIDPHLVLSFPLAFTYMEYDSAPKV